MGIAEGRADFRNDAQGFGGRQSAAGHDLPQIDAVHVFHEEPAVACHFPEIINADNVGMLEAREGLALPGEPLHKGRIGGEAGSHDLESSQPVQSALPDAVDPAHAAAADQFENGELREQSAQFLFIRSQSRGYRLGIRWQDLAQQTSRAKAAGGVCGNGLTALGTWFGRFHGSLFRT